MPLAYVLLPCSGLHPTWTNTTGVQCVIPYIFEEQDHLRFHFIRTNTSSTYSVPGLPGVVVNGSVWTLTATLMSQHQRQPARHLPGHSDNITFQPHKKSEQSSKQLPKQFDIGTVFLEQTFGGVTRLGAFHEHIGCTPCDAFYESESRSSLQVHSKKSMRSG